MNSVQGFEFIQNIGSSFQKSKFQIRYLKI